MIVKIGLAISTHNRYHIFLRSYMECLERLPKDVDCQVVVVDDCSDNTNRYADYRFSVNAGIAKTKNKCIQLLMERGCTDLFLFDDDSWPITKDWYKPYMDSGEGMLQHVWEDKSRWRKPNHSKPICEVDGLVSWTHPKGVMLYIKDSTVKTIGGFREDLGKYGYEHTEYADRAFHAGLTTYRYGDVVNSYNLIYALDREEKKHKSSVPEKTARVSKQKVKHIYDELRATQDTTFQPYC